MSDDLWGFRIKYGDIEIEYRDNNTNRVSVEYGRVREWLEKTVEKQLTALEKQVKELKEDMADLKRIQKEDQYKPDKTLRRP